jgi:nucleotide-binding universal stress UspA family protein
MTRISRDVVVVGLEHTEAGSAALRWAVAESERIRARVMAVHVYDPSRPDLRHEKDPEGEKSRERIEAHRQLIDVVGRDAPKLAIAISQVEGSLLDRLSRAAENAVMLVVGEPSDPQNADLPARLAASCRCPVIMVRPDGGAIDISHAADEELPRRQGSRAPA